MTEARSHGGGAVEDTLAAWRGACSGASPPSGGAIGIIDRFFSPIAAEATRAAARFSSHNLVVADTSSSPQPSCWRALRRRRAVRRYSRPRAGASSRTRARGRGPVADTSSRTRLPLGGALVLELRLTHGPAPWHDSRLAMLLGTIPGTCCTGSYSIGMCLPSWPS